MCEACIAPLCLLPASPLSGDHGDPTVLFQDLYWALLGVRVHSATVSNTAGIVPRHDAELCAAEGFPLEHRRWQFQVSAGFTEDLCLCPGCPTRCWDDPTPCWDGPFSPASVIFVLTLLMLNTFPRDTFENGGNRLSSSSKVRTYVSGHGAGSSPCDICPLYSCSQVFGELLYPPSLQWWRF